jgi:hypothetical protein
LVWTHLMMLYRPNASRMRSPQSGSYCCSTIASISSALPRAWPRLRANPAAHVIATSREPLRAEGECLYRVPSLAVPVEGSREEDPLRYGAVRLFFARARAAEPQFSADGQIAAVIAAICRQLDGIPLAIQLAAARTNALGVEELACRLDDCFDLLTGGRRAALPRHQTLARRLTGAISCSRSRNAWSCSAWRSLPAASPWRRRVQ